MKHIVLVLLYVFNNKIKIIAEGDSLDRIFMILDAGYGTVIVQ